MRLGPPPPPTPELLGARIFYDSRRSRGGWYSCHSCHPDGGTRGFRFDTRTDGHGAAKRVPALWDVGTTGPWSWIARFDRLDDQLATSMRTTMAVDHDASPHDVTLVRAFLDTLRPPDASHAAPARREAVQRGAELFDTAGCADCHRGGAKPPRLRDVGVFDTGDGRTHFNPPSLLRVRDRFRWLHDGRARSLREIFTRHDELELHGDAHELSPRELDDLVAYLRTL